jgi:hypothetical protein
MIRNDFIFQRFSGRRGAYMDNYITGVIPFVCFADTDWNLYDAENWNNINTNWNDCL